MKWIAYLLSAIVAGLGILIVISTLSTVAQLPHVELKDYLLLIQVIMTFLTAFALAVYSSATAKSTEELKAQLAREVGGSIEELKADLGQVVPKTHEAYHAMWDAATKYHKSLRQFELGKFLEEDLKEADASCNSARGRSLLADPGDIERFDQFWQEANFIKEEGEKVRGDPDALRAFWQKEARAFGNLYSQLRETFAQRLLA